MIKRKRSLMLALLMAMCITLAVTAISHITGARGVFPRDGAVGLTNAVQPQAAAESQSNVFPYISLLVLLSAFAIAGRKSREHSFTQKIASENEGVVPAVRFSDVAANDEAMSSLRDILSFIQQPEKYRRLGARIPRGVMLYGMPGTGKTLMARALAGEAGVPFYAVNGADFVEMYVGVGASRVRALFRKARKSGRAVIFIDEIDAIGGRRDNQSEESARTLNALLSEMSGFRDSDGTVVLAATNRLDSLDEALLRAGRFDRQIEVPLPTQDERLRILQTHARNKPLESSVDLRELAAQTALFSGAKLEGVLNEAAILAAKRDASEISASDVDRAMDTILFGGERRDWGDMEREREITAAHEAGHALLTALLLPDSTLKKVSIIPTGSGAAGYSMAIPSEKLFHQKRELLNHMAVALAGREAERMLIGSEQITTGASGDIEKAAAIARRMVNEWGMLPTSDEVYLFSQTQREAAAQQWLAVARGLAQRTLTAYLPAWHRLSARLKEREVLGQREVLECISGESAGTSPQGE